MLSIQVSFFYFFFLTIIRSILGSAWNPYSAQRWIFHFMKLETKRDCENTNKLIAGILPPYWTDGIIHYIPFTSLERQDQKPQTELVFVIVATNGARLKILRRRPKDPAPHSSSTTSDSQDRKLVHMLQKIPFRKNDKFWLWTLLNRCGLQRCKDTRSDTWTET